VTAPFRFRFRVRYGECDPQQIVFNARWGDYVDVAATEYCRVVFGAIDAAVTGIDWRLVRQVLEWKAPGRFDDVIEAEVITQRVGTTSFALATRFSRWPGGGLLVTAETVYVVVDPRAGTKRAVPDRHRGALAAGAAGVIVDHAGTGAPSSPA